MYFSGLKVHQLYPCTVFTSDGVQWPVSCFVHNLTWWACQLAHVVDDSVSAKSLERLDISVLPRELRTTSAFLPLMMSLSTLTGIMVFIAQS